MNTQVLHNGHYSTRAGQHNLPRVLSGDDRQRAFRQARRHTMLVRALRFLLPLTTCGVLALYFVPNSRLPVLQKLPASVDGFDLSSKGLKMINPHYNGGDDKTGRYRIGADYAIQNIGNLKVFDLHKITAQIDHPDNKWTRLTANEGTFDSAGSQLALREGIEITSDRGLGARLKSAQLDLQQQLVTSGEPVILTMERNRIDADTMQLWGKEKRLLLKGRVKVRMYRDDGKSAGTPADTGNGAQSPANNGMTP